ncbi:nuclease-related domain-containing protein [Lederbergia panacisoli]|uniref:nuclease-related domain-containing protein n=1 Tax=Lederbergia panacisoli TaxID=1255251 RepID=UPI00214AF160|nr:nuclease-related domain-containing protein [Lederbergia panacisoli]MCR2821491.1 NERD domain-containing protein [Lederbergia panacisoli]
MYPVYDTILLIYSKEEKKISTVKFRSDCLGLQGLEATRSRLPDGHVLYPTILSKIASAKAGIAGEDKVADVLLRNSFSIDHRIFHDLSLTTSTQFQMDTLFLSRLFAIILEVKNISGILEFRENPPQLIRIKTDGTVDGFECPAAQVERNAILFKEFLSQVGIDIPVIGAVVLAYPKQIVKVAPKRTKVLFPSIVPQHIKSLYHLPQKIDVQTLDSLTSQLLDSHQPYIPNPICETYGIPRNDIKKGVQCKICGWIGMQKIIRSWHCPSCKNYDHLAHRNAIKEWLLLFGRRISNRDCRDFLKINDMKTATRILQTTDLYSEGTFRNRTYSMDLNKYR